MKTLFLASYFTAVENLFKRFLKQHFLLHKVLFIPTAGNVESYVEYIDEVFFIFSIEANKKYRINIKLD